MVNIEDEKLVIVDKIKKFLYDIENTTVIQNKVNNIIMLFEYIITIPKFLCFHAKFRSVVVAKVEALKNDPIINDFNDDRVSNRNEFFKTADKLDKFVKELRFRNDYIFDLLEPKNIVITI